MTKRRTWPGRPLPSTQAFSREASCTPGFSRIDWVHGYIYARWPYLYIGIAVGEHPLARLFRPLGSIISSMLGIGDGSPQDDAQVSFADTYHGKVVPLEAARQLVTINQDIALTNLEQVIPYKLARDIVLRNPDHIVVLDCPCRAARPNPCLPLDVCLIVGEPFASLVAEHHPHRSRWITQDEAVSILEATQERGHVSHAFFKDAMLSRFYAICNCCKCCCGAMQAWQHGTPMLTSSGYVSRVDAALCGSCATCVEFCQFEAITLRERCATVDESRCMGCGVCVSKCQHGALSLHRDASRGEPLEILELVAQSRCDMEELQ